MAKYPKYATEGYKLAAARKQRPGTYSETKYRKGNQKFIVQAMNFGKTENDSSERPSWHWRWFESDENNAGVGNRSGDYSEDEFEDEFAAHAAGRNDIDRMLGQG